MKSMSIATLSRRHEVAVAARLPARRRRVPDAAHAGPGPRALPARAARAPLAAARARAQAARARPRRRHRRPRGARALRQNVQAAQDQTR